MRVTYLTNTVFFQIITHTTINKLFVNLDLLISQSRPLLLNFCYFHIYDGDWSPTLGIPIRCNHARLDENMVLISLFLEGIFRLEAQESYCR